MLFIKTWMIGIYLPLISAILSDTIKDENVQNVQEQAVRDLIQRLMPEHADKFRIAVDFGMKKNDKDSFELEKLDTVNIRATSGVAAAAGLHHYLKYFCAAHVSWDFHQLNLTKCKHVVHELIEFNDKYRFYQNACTPGYSYVWWDWTKWEEHIDWMALQGFNLVPAMNGQEAIWQRVYGKLGMTQQEIDEQFTGPAFLPWNRMGNLRGFAGSLSNSWHSNQLALNAKIISRLREFGITTVLPAFGGQVPRAFKRIYPNATYYQLPRWNNFNDTYCCPYLLDPTDDLFQQVGALFLNEITKEWGSDHIYSCDTFNEMTPFTTDLDELRQIGQAIYSTMSSFDSQAIWVCKNWRTIAANYKVTWQLSSQLLFALHESKMYVNRLMQGWLFHHEAVYWNKQRAKALLTSIPIGKMIILDLQSEQFPQYQRLDNYFGQPYIWCMLHNFGATLGMFGSAEIINNNVFEARNMPNSTLIGTGLTPEGIDQNYAMYDLMTEMSWRKDPVNLSTWFKDYPIRRYGKEIENITEAWSILKDTVFTFNLTTMMRGKYVYNRSPRTKFLPWTWYDQQEVITAFVLTYDNTLELFKDSRNYRHDYIDLGRQVLQNAADNIYVQLIAAFRNKDIVKFNVHAEQFMLTLNLAEQLLSFDEKYLLGKWLNSAKAAADNENDAILFEYNARNQITLWGADGQIMDYANKQWSGVVGDLFKPRWALFLEHMNDSLRHGVKFNEHGAQQDVFEKVEVPFTFSRKIYPDSPQKSLDDFQSVLKQIHSQLDIIRKYTMENKKKKKNKN